MPEAILQAAAPAPLTTLTEDEILFRDNIRQFADEKIRPLVKEMDEKGVFDKDLIHDFFQLGLMGIEIPEQYGGGGAKFFEAILAVEELSRVDASAGVIVDVQNTLVNNALLRWGNEEQKKRYLPQDGRRDGRRLRLERGGIGFRCVCACRRAPRSRAASTCSTAASCGSPTAKRRDCSCSSPRSIRLRDTKASRRFWSRKISPDSPSARKKTSSASARRPPAS